MRNKSQIPVLSFVGYSGAGKTTLLEKIVAELSGKGFAVSVLKHTHHKFELDKPGKDSSRFKQAGAKSVALLSPSGWAVTGEEPQISFAEILAKMPDCDLILTEGGSWFNTPKIEVIGANDGRPLKSAAKDLVALAGENISHENIPCFERNDASAIADFLVTNYIKGSARASEK